jgi:hypothetical protein
MPDYLKNIKIIITAWTTKPNPMVIILSMSFWTAALAKKNSRPVQIIRTMSTGGGLSVMPAISANRAGMVAPWMKRIPNHPSVSAENLDKCSPQNFLIGSVILYTSNLNACKFGMIFAFRSVEDMGSNLIYPFEFPTRVNIVCVIIQCIFQAVKPKTF